MYIKNIVNVVKNNMYDKYSIILFENLFLILQQRVFYLFTHFNISNADLYIRIL